MKKILPLSLLASSLLLAGGYKIPELSLNATALSSANVAHCSGADTAYYNPANMVFMKGGNTLETDLTYIGLGDINYKGSYTYSAGLGGATLPNVNTNSKRENFLLPALFYVSDDVGGARFGLSVVTPYGLTKRWSEQPGQASAQEFTLQTIEVNPTIALPIGDKLAVAIGIRAVHSSGIVRAQLPGVMSQHMEGDSIDFGYNLALAYKPTPELEFGLTYRSKIDLSLDGDADVFYAPGGTIDPLRNVDASVEVPMPPALNIAVAYTLPSDTTFEFVYERSFWSEYSELDFNFADPVAEAVFGAVSKKNWKDVNAYRLGITQKLDRTTIMCGIVLDETPIPNAKLGYELPDSDSLSLSIGGRYQVNEKLNLGLSTLYSIREDRKVSNSSLTGEFTDSSALLISLGLEYKF